jgi:hypothetical protein
LRKVPRPVTTTDAVAATKSVASAVAVPPAAIATPRRCNVTKLASEKRTVCEAAGTASTR